MELLLLLGLLLGIGVGASTGDSDEGEETDEDNSLDHYRPSSGIQHFTSSSSGYDPMTGDWWRHHIDITMDDD